MSQSDFTLRSRQWIIGGALVALSAMTGVQEAWGNTEPAGSSKLQNVDNSTRTTLATTPEQADTEVATEALLEADSMMDVAIAELASSEQATTLPHLSSDMEIEDSGINGTANQGGLLVSLEPTAQKTVATQTLATPSTLTPSSALAVKTNLAVAENQEAQGSPRQQLLVDVAVADSNPTLADINATTTNTKVTTATTTATTATATTATTVMANPTALKVASTTNTDTSPSSTSIATKVTTASLGAEQNDSNTNSASNVPSATNTLGANNTSSVIKTNDATNTNTAINLAKANTNTSINTNSVAEATETSSAIKETSMTAIDTDNGNTLATGVETNEAKTEGSSISDSMIKPNRPTDLLYSTGAERKEVVANSNEVLLASNNSSLVDGAANSPAEQPLKSIVIYFSAPEEAAANDVDSLTGASLIEANEQVQGITEYVAKYIGQQQELEVYKIGLEGAYPSEHSKLIERSQEDNAKIKVQDFNLGVKLEPEVDLSQVDTIYLGFPLWWNDLPLPVYAFLQQADLSGKTILPFCTYGYNTPYQLFKRIEELEPNAKVLRGHEVNKNRLVKKQIHKRLDRWLAEQGNKDGKGQGSKALVKNQ